MSLAEFSLDFAFGYLGVSLGGAEVTMAEKSLEVCKLHTSLGQMRGAGVAEPVGRELETENLAVLLHDVEESRGRQPLTLVVEEKVATSALGQLLEPPTF